MVSEDDRVDVVLEPTTKCTAPPRGDGYDSGRLGGEGDPLIELTAHWNVTGFPVAALPAAVGAGAGCRSGISLIAPRGAEARVLQIGIDLQEHALLHRLHEYGPPQGGQHDRHQRAPSAPTRSAPGPSGSSA